MKIVFTGGCGQLGSIVGHYLQTKNYDIVFIDNLSHCSRNNLKESDTFILDDIRNPDFKRYLNDVDCVFHFAAISSLPENQSNPYESYDNNVAGTINVLEACRLAKVRKFVFASTSAIYENNRKYPFKEEDTVSPHLTYSVGKKHCEDIINSYSKLYGMDTTILRFFNVYSAAADMHRKSPPLIAYLINSYMHNEVPILHSDGSQSRDYIYASDASNICELVINGGKNETFNACSGNVVSVNDIVKEVRKYFPNSKEPIFRDSKLLWDKYDQLKKGYELNPDYIEAETLKYSLGSNKKAFKHLGWKPKISLEEGIKIIYSFL